MPYLLDDNSFERTKTAVQFVEKIIRNPSPQLANPSINSIDCLAKLTSSYSSGYQWDYLYVDGNAYAQVGSYGSDADYGKAEHVYGCTDLKSGTLVRMLGTQLFTLLETLIVPVMTTSSISAGGANASSYGTGTCSYGGSSITVHNYYNSIIASGVMVYVILQSGGWQVLTENCS